MTARHIFFFTIYNSKKGSTPTVSSRRPCRRCRTSCGAHLRRLTQSRNSRILGGCSGFGHNPRGPKHRVPVRKYFQGQNTLERFAVENGNRSGGRGSGRPRRMSLKTTLFRRNDGSAAFEIGQFQKQNALDTPTQRLSRRAGGFGFPRAAWFRTGKNRIFKQKLWI